MFTVYTVFFWAKNNTDHKKNLKHLKRTVWQDKPITSCSNLLLATVEITALSCFKVETNKAVSTSSQFYYGWSYVFGWLAVPFLFLCGGSGIASIFKRPNVQVSNNMQAVVPIITSSSVPYDKFNVSTPAHYKIWLRSFKISYSETKTYFKAKK